MLQFPASVSSPITLFIPFTDNLTGNQINITAVLQGCFPNEDSVSIFGRTGVQTRFSATVFIPYQKNVTGQKYVMPHEWNELPIDQLNRHWTVNPRQLSLLLPEESDFQFTWAAPNAANRISIQENSFMTANPDVRRVVDVNTQFFGSEDMWHVVLRC